MDRDESASIEWRYIMRRLEQDGAHPSDRHLAHLVREGPIPVYARDYVASRIGRGPGKRTYKEPFDFGMYGPFTQEQVDAVNDLAYLEDFLYGWDPITGKPLGWDPKEITDPDKDESQRLLFKRTLEIPVCGRDGDGRDKATFEYRWIESRKLWRMRSPMEQAIDVTAKAKRHIMAVPTLAKLWYEFTSFDFFDGMPG